MVTDIEALLKKAKPRETTVALYLDGTAGVEIERLERQLQQVSGATWQPSSMADTDPGREIAAKIAVARKKLQSSETEFRFRALPDRAWSDLLAAHPPRENENLFNADTFPRALIAACAVDPVMSPEQVDRLFAVINQAQRNEIFDGAYNANQEASTVPFSVTASAILSGLGAEK